MCSASIRGRTSMNMGTGASVSQPNSQPTRTRICQVYGGAPARLVVLGVGSADEAISRAGDRLDVPRLVPVVLKLRAQGSHVAVHHVAFDNEVGAPERVEDLLAGEDVAGVGGEKIQERLLERGQVELVLSRDDLSVQDVDLEVADAQSRDQLAGAAMCAADHGARARDEIVRHEGNADVIVRATLEGVELSAQVAASRERDDAQGGVVARLVDELDPGAGFGVDVDQEQMGLPFRERGLRASDRFGDPPEIASVPQGQVDGVREGLIADDQENTSPALGSSSGRCPCGSVRHRTMLGASGLVDANAELPAEG